jgi:hypothetical protein
MVQVHTAYHRRFHVYPGLVGDFHANTEPASSLLQVHGHSTQTDGLP